MKANNAEQINMITTEALRLTLGGIVCQKENEN